MLQIQVLKNNTEQVKQLLQVKNFTQLHLVDEVIALDDDRKKTQTQLDELLATVNQASKEIGKLMAAGQKQQAEEAKTQVANAKLQIEPLKASLSELERSIESILFQIPNTPTPEVPVGKTPEENVEVRAGGVKPTLAADAVPHWDLAKKYNLIDFELGNKVTGSGFPFYIGKGAKLQRSLIQYFLDFNTQAGYLEYLPPFMVNTASAFGTGQLPDKEGQMYHMPADDF
ncbi:MAG: serine--tRNA ligase, partial [Bacteroidetes bacterium]